MPLWENQAPIPAVFPVKLKSKVHVILFPTMWVIFGHQNHKVKGLEC